MYSYADEHGETFLQYRAAEYAGYCEAVTGFRGLALRAPRTRRNLKSGIEE